MATSDRRYTDAPDDLTDRVRSACAGLPDAYEESAWAGTRWKIRNRTFAQVLGVETDDGAPVTALSFRATGEDFEMLSHAGHPFFVLGWGRNALGMILDDDTDWDEVRELVTESFCVLAPKKLVTLVERPESI
ncbi:MAG: MmcQ/YjbR family DNA-binding protein [Actinomycetota bacterium]